MLNQVFVNRTLNMRKIKFIGLDMDHTLVRYNTKAFEELAHKTIIQKLIKRGYPQKIENLQFDFDTAIRGLIIDKNRGNILKVSRHGAIRGSRHGTQDIDFQTQQKFIQVPILICLLLTIQQSIQLFQSRLPFYSHSLWI